MFRLQRLEITGFKSFADYTEVIFTGKGITAVVGPNGCGKSNVSEAIAWVLGEQSAKNLRGQEMKDVVFQGTKKRNPSGMAEVVLHLIRDETEYISEETELEDIDAKLGEIDENAVNVDVIEAEHLQDDAEEDVTLLADDIGTEVEMETVKAAQVGSVNTIQRKVATKRRWRPRNFALDFAPGESVSVTRRLYLSGESDYLLNDKTCRLRDIQDLFSGTGLSGAHYAIVEQGRIGQILSSKPSNRRGLIEEAAGISKFRKRQRAAESRLESAKTNLSRITDIVAEIEKQTRSLRRQANKTKRFKILKEELRVLLKQTYAAEGRDLSIKIGELESKLAEANKKEREILGQVSEKDEAFRESTGLARSAEENLTEVRANHSKNALERDRSERELGYQQQQTKEIETRSSVLDAEIKNTGERIRLIGNEIERLEKEASIESEKADSEQQILLKAESEYRAKLDEMRGVEVELETERESHLEHTAAVERLAEIERQFETNLEKLGERIEGLQREHERAEKVFAERKQEAVSLEKSVREERKKLEALHAEKQRRIEDANSAREKLEAEEGALKTVKDKYSQQKHRLDTLKELDENRAVYAPSVQKLFAQQKKIGVNFLGTLADEINVGEKAESVIENLFGTFLQTVLVKSERDAKKAVKYLNDNNLGRIPVLVFDTGSQSKKDAMGNDRSIASFLGIGKDFAAVLAKVFPREMSAKVVDSLDKAKSRSDEIVITQNGDLIIGGKLYIGGRANSNDKNSSLLALKRELRELGKSAGKTQKETEKAQKKVDKTMKLLSGCEDEIVDLQAFIVKNEREVLSHEIHSKSLVQEIERAERHKKVVKDEITQITAEIRQIEKRRIESQKNAKTAEKARLLSADKIEAVTKQLNAVRKVVEAENQKLSEKRTQAQVAAERKRSAQNALARLKTENADFEARIERQRLEKKQNVTRLEEIASSRARLKEKIALAEMEYSQEEVELNEAIKHLKEARETTDSMSAKLAELNKASAMARDERAGLEINHTELVTRLESLTEKCVQDLNVDLKELVKNTELDEDFEFVAARERVSELRDKLDRFGAINMLALEELGETEERLEFLTSQRQDIVDSIEAAEQALSEIKRRSRQRFKDAFEAINKNFTEFFAELFGGGQGEMKLLEAEDILESGIEIVAQPPGKRLQNMLLLSGGEKAMTAIALVLAIFKYRPSPFCLLDEVDAPLDDANVGRFVKRIAEMSEKTQFIVITHNKRTMEAAKALYGVTMQEAGVSKIVSVRFE
ncbi:MAG: chromosome segregation protein SMC [Pyrinomonadaceae bacterium]|nr:chromosome segregation protein SMC [Pyrinomonadaceae bacterium]